MEYPSNILKTSAEVIPLLSTLSYVPSLATAASLSSIISISRSFAICSASLVSHIIQEPSLLWRISSIRSSISFFLLSRSSSIIERAAPGDPCEKYARNVAVSSPMPGEPLIIISLVSPTASGKNLTSEHLDITVGSKSSFLLVSRMIIAFPGGSSRTFNKAFAASVVIRCASSITHAINGAS